MNSTATSTDATPTTNRKPPSQKQELIAANVKALIEQLEAGHQTCYKTPCIKDSVVALKPQMANMESVLPPPGSKRNSNPYPRLLSERL